jgi:hypothetical protein
MNYFSLTPKYILNSKTKGLELESYIKCTNYPQYCPYSSNKICGFWCSNFESIISKFSTNEWVKLHCCGRKIKIERRI